MSIANRVLEIGEKLRGEDTPLMAFEKILDLVVLAFGELTPFGSLSTLEQIERSFLEQRVKQWRRHGVIGGLEIGAIVGVKISKLRLLRCLLLAAIAVKTHLLRSAVSFVHP